MTAAVAVAGAATIAYLDEDTSEKTEYVGKPLMTHSLSLTAHVNIKYSIKYSPSDY